MSQEPEKLEFKIFSNFLRLLVKLFIVNGEKATVSLTVALHLGSSRVKWTKAPCHETPRPVRQCGTQDICVSDSKWVCLTLFCE